MLPAATLPPPAALLRALDAHEATGDATRRGLTDELKNHINGQTKHAQQTVHLLTRTKNTSK
jgi:hypothetical protein